MRTIAELENQVKDLQSKIDTMIESKKYNGWKNYETWNVQLWLDNDSMTNEIQSEWLNDAKEYVKENPSELMNGIFTVDDVVKRILADRIKEFVEENNPLNDTSTMFADLLNSALSNVDYYEIAENIMSDC